jgi:bleomycin hydrolase
MGKEEMDLSEIYFVYYTYITKGFDYVRYHGNANFSEGGQAHDVTNVIKTYGLVPESIYSGMNYKSEYHNHSDFAKSLTEIVKKAAKDKENQKMNWFTSFKELLDSILGEAPLSFNYKGKEYTPASFNEKEVGFDPSNYIEFTSYTHHPFYEHVDLEVPDNWSHDRYYNLPIEEFMTVMDHALKNGYSIAWDGDVSEKGFDHKTGISDLAQQDFDHLMGLGFQKYRQKTFNDFTTTDDHLMHVVGIAKNKDRKKFYITKNSWGVYNDYGGYLFMSEDYVKVKTVAFMVHKDAVPDAIAKKIGLK